MRRRPTYCCSRTCVHLSVMLGAFGLALVMSGCAVTEAQTQAKVKDAESIASLPFERRVCRRYLGPVTATVNFDAAAYGITTGSAQIVTVKDDGKSEPFNEPAAFKRQLTFAPFMPWAWEISW